jgi:Glutaredoxin-like domain (DUF836)
MKAQEGNVGLVRLGTPPLQSDVGSRLSWYLLAGMNHIIVSFKPGCCLCDEVKAQLRKLQEQLTFDWKDMNILDDPEAFEKFSQEIPVIFINGRKAFKFHLDEADFIRRLHT